MRNFTAVYADVSQDDVAEIMANPKCRFGSHADLAAERDALAGEVERLRQRFHEVSLDWQCQQAEIERLREDSFGWVKAWNAKAKELAGSQAREAKLREALQTFIDEHDECTDPDDWTAYMCSLEAVHEADNALALPTDDTVLKEYLLENGYRQCAKGQRTTQFCGMVEEAKKQAKREALLDVIAEWEKPWGLTDGTPFIDRLRIMAWPTTRALKP